MIEVRHLTKWYDGSERLAVNNLTFEVKGGEILGLLGTNGAGKSTTMSIMVGLLKATSGEVFIDKKDVTTDLIDIKRITGYLPEVPHLYDRLTGFEYLKMIGELRGMEERHINLKIARYGNFLELSDRLDSFIGTYSKGMVQKLAFAGAIMHEPKILIMDEPTSGLDPRYAKRIREHIRRYRDPERAIVLSTHIVDIAERICDRILIIHEGRKMILGTIDFILEYMETKSLEDAFIKLIGESDVYETTP